MVLPFLLVAGVGERQLVVVKLLCQNAADLLVDARPALGERQLLPGKGVSDSDGLTLGLEVRSRSNAERAGRQAPLAVAMRQAAADGILHHATPTLRRW
ncbi:hypothetical protein ACFWP7_08185 [Streptomyces sp. NPDC058470]|uniref:hypothetical protein n=1 Tax=Streptomyces sp. NPDC058470 TaxID=3346515 RepID=UPI003659473B